MTFCDGSTTIVRPAHQSEGGGSTPTPSLHKSRYLIRACPLKEAKDMVRAHHYSKGSSNTAVYAHGLYERANERLIGVALWLPPTRVACESVNRAEWRRVLSLTRLVCLPDAPKNSASFLLSHSIQMIRKDGRFVSLVTYADEGQNHTGQIYRATNWKYIGRTGPYPRWVDSTGRQVATLSTKTRTKAKMLELGHVRVGAFHKHKFVMHLGGRP